MDGEAALHHAAKVVTQVAWLHRYRGLPMYLLEKGGSELVEIEDDKEHNTAIFCAVGKLCYESMKVKSGDKKASPANLAEAQACVAVLLKS